MKVAIQGEHGSFHDAAAHEFFDEPVLELVPCASFREVFTTLHNSGAEAGLVAVENSLYGSIHEVYDQLVTSKASVVGEVTLAIRQQLICHEGVQLDDIQEVYSHPAALSQCSNWLDEHLPKAERIEYYDTAGAVAHIKRHTLKNAAAIAPEAAAAAHAMTILASNIEDDAGNFTRFLVLKRTPEAVPHADKASLILMTSHRPGALYAALGTFARYDCNLTKLESRPIRGRPFQYQFIVDVLASRDQLLNATVELEQQGCNVNLLGHYAAH